MIFKRVLRAPMLFFENNPLGRILNRLTRDVGIIDQVIPNSVVELQMVINFLISQLEPNQMKLFSLMNY